MGSECIGCKSYKNETYCLYGIVHNVKDTDGCPCKRCLVKGICSNNLCDDFIEYKLLSREVKGFEVVLREFNEKGVSYWY